MTTEEILKSGLRGLAKICEELQTTQGLLKISIEETKKTNSFLRQISEAVSKSEGHLFTLNDTEIKSLGINEEMKNISFITEQNVIRLLQAHKEGMSNE